MRRTLLGLALALSGVQAGCAETQDESGEQSGEGVEVVRQELVGWGSWFSEEAPGNPALCNSGSFTSATATAINGFACRGGNCDDMRFRCGGLPTDLRVSAATTGSTQYTKPYISEESPAYQTVCNAAPPGGGATCDDCVTGLVVGIGASGSRSDNIQVYCRTFAAQPASNRLRCKWTGERPSQSNPYGTGTWISEEPGTNLRFGDVITSGSTIFSDENSSFIAGVRCQGSRCDNMAFYYCSLDNTPGWDVSN